MARLRQAMKRSARWIAPRLATQLVNTLAPAVIRPATREGPRAVLLIRLDLVGDLVMTLPAMRAVRRTYPTARLCALVTPTTAPLLVEESIVDEVIAIDPNAIRQPRAWLQPRRYRHLVHVVRRLRSEQFDLALSFFGEFACLFAFASGAPVRIGFAGEAYPGALTVALPQRRYHGIRHEIDYNGLIAQAAGASDYDTTPRLSPTAGERVRVDALLSARGVAARPRVVLHVGAQNGRAKRWPPDQWAELGNRLAQELHVTLLFTGAVADDALIDEVRTQMVITGASLAGHTDLRLLVALIASADLVISGDSAPVHIASAVGTPVIGIYGPTDPSVYGPSEQRGSVVLAGLPCSPCYNLLATAECPWGVRPAPCMRAVTAADVFGAARAALRREKRTT